MWRNWSGLETATPHRIEYPRTPAAVARACRRAAEAGERIKMVGTGHSFTGVAVPEQVMLSPTRLRGVIEVDPAGRTVTALAGTPLHELNAVLTEHGLALHNMGDIAEQTLAGAIATGTHGTGGRVASLAGQVVALTLVDGTGAEHRLSAADPEFDAARVGLGALGVLTSVTFAVEEQFVLRASERRGAWSEVIDHYDEVAAAHDHLDLLWFPHTDHLQVKANDRLAVPVDEAEPLPAWRHRFEYDFMENTVFGAVQSVLIRAPRLTPRVNPMVTGLISERSYSDLSHRVFVTRRSSRFSEMEYALPREHGIAALREVRRRIEASDWRLSYPVEIRSTPPDDPWLSTSHGRDSIYLAFHVPAGVDHRPYFTGVEEILVRYDGRPHWGKLHTRTAEDLADCYPRWADFAAVRERWDPARIFSNAYLERVLGS